MPYPAYYPDTGPRAQQRKRFYKTRLCPYHFKKGSACKGGDHCSYAHSFQELRPSVDLTKTKLCQDYLSGICLRRPDECPFAHGEPDIRPVKTMINENVIRSGSNPWHSSGFEFQPRHAHTRARTMDLAEQKVSHSHKQPLSQTQASWSMETNGIFHYQLGTPKARPQSQMSATRHDFTPSPFGQFRADSSEESCKEAPRMTDDWYPDPQAESPSSSVMEVNTESTKSTVASPDVEEPPQVTLSVNQLANIILAAHAAESPNDLVSDVLGFIYK